MKAASTLLLLACSTSATAQTSLGDPYGNKFDVHCSPTRQMVVTKHPTAELVRLYKQIAKNDVLLGQALKHPEPEYRFTGVYAIAVRKAPRQDDLIRMLDDKHPSVRLAARQALVILTTKYGKREDFGPLAGANAEQITESQETWRAWFVPRAAIQKPLKKDDRR